VHVPIQCQQTDTLPIHTRRISDKVLVVWPGDFAQTTNMIAVASERGIVVVDTESSWSVTAEIRDVIAREFGRDDFAYLINTHGHMDHGGGNQVFRDTEIIGHERCVRLLENALGTDNLNARRERLGNWIAGLTQQLDSLPVGGPEALTGEERVLYWRRVVADLESGFELTLPRMTFSDGLALDLGDVTVQMYYFGGLHTDDHLVVHVPEEGLLLTGDILADSWIPVLSDGVEVDIPLMLAHWKMILRNEAQLRHIVNGHWDNDVSPTYFQQAHRYVRTIWEELREARSRGAGLESVYAQLDLESRFPEFRELVHEYEGVNYHRKNIEIVWALLGTESPFSNLHGPYLGQEPPGLTPKGLTPGLISVEGRDEAGLVVAPGGREVFSGQWSRSRGAGHPP
jgi:glyoxylase-like metal-dependent hydrolase (beta-lactamase superfamily II)